MTGFLMDCPPSKNSQSAKGIEEKLVALQRRVHLKP
jgi:hypothetical protein